MTTPRDRPRLRPEVMIDANNDQHARIAWDILGIVPHTREIHGILEIVPRTWAIHGTIAVDGEVILAEFDSPDAARAVLDSLGAADGGVVADNS